MPPFGTYIFSIQILLHLKELFMGYVSDEYIAKFFATLVTLKLHCTKKTVEFPVLW